VTDTPAFVADARAFAARHRGRLLFRLLRAYTGCTAEELDHLAAKAYCLSVPDSQIPCESAAKHWFGVLAAPLVLLRRVRPVEASPVVDWQLDVEDERYFRERFAEVYAELPGSKRVGPRSGTVAGAETTGGVDAAASPRAWLLLAFAPLMQLALWWLAIVRGVDIMRGYRGALMTFTLYDGYFRRWPCRCFVTYADDGNDPARYVAFRRNGGTSLVAVQNGERGWHPVWAFGMVDVYLLFGEAYRRMLEPMGYRVRRSAAVGSVALDARLATLGPLSAEKRWDVLFVDSGTMLPPLFGGLCVAAGDAETALVRRLGELARRNPELRVAYQPRNYTAEAMPEAVAAIRAVAGEDAEVLGNDGRGEAYRNVAAADVVVTFQSTLGFEAFMLSAKTLFVNFSPFETETLCEDPRFQLVDPSAAYEPFERAVLGVRALRLDGPPPVALAHICAADSGTQRRIADVLRSLPIESSAVPAIER
jgi:hypothetical protein